MAKRIYALAKELNVDSKELVEACTKAGITGKGSALASLDDGEIAKVKAYLGGGSSAESKTPKKMAAPVRDTKEKKIRTIPPKSTKRPVSVGGSDDADEDSGDTATATKDKPEDSADPSRMKEPVRGISREDYIGPGGAPRKPKTIKPKPKTTLKPEAKKKPEAETGDAESGKKERAPRLAAMPEPKAPPPEEKKAEEPAAQKPAMRLPKDAIRGAKAGSKAPLEQFTTRAKREEAKRGKPEAEPTDKAKGKGRRGKADAREKDEDMAGMSSSRASRQQARRGRQRGGLGLDEGEYRRRDRRRRSSSRTVSTAAPRKGAVVLELPCTVRSFSETTGVPTAQVQRELMQLGTMATINHELDVEMAELLAEQLELEVEFRRQESLEEKLLTEIEQYQDDPADLETRPPIVTFLGHVDHGKTSLLDAIIGINVVTGEAGGITQHIRAYTIDKDGRPISFVDTPGHEAFTEMRARGANVTDIAVLVVAADDGIMPQTEEAISHARAAEVPIVVALNKMDLPGADPDRVLQQLAAQELLPSEWGGDIEVVRTSATNGDGLDDLLETLLLTAEIHEYKSNPKRRAMGVCLEAEQESDRGVIAKVMVRTGTLRPGDIVLCGEGHGRVKAMFDTLKPNERLEEAGPSVPVNITGLDRAPDAGDTFYVLDNLSQARELAEARAHESRQTQLSGVHTRVSFEEFQHRLEEGLLGGDTDEVVELNLIIRADVRGSIEAILKELEKIEHPEVRVKVMQASVGGVTVGDVTLADASNAVIIGFNVIPDESARNLAEQRGVQIRRYDIIYKVTEDIRAMLEGRLKPEEQVVDLGRALVQQTFSISRVGTIAGCRILAGTVERNCRIRVNREARGIGDYPLESLRREKEDVKSVREGMECGIKLAGFNDVKEGDILEAYKIEEVARTL